MNPHPLKQREQDLMQFYSYCQLGMTPKQFYTKWQVSYEEMAQICVDTKWLVVRHRSLSTVRRWFARGKNYRRPMPADLRHLALMNFLLEHFEEIPQELLQKLPRNNVIPFE
ncbi:helix-turn-helix domain-containing protein [Nostoc sp. FACHB-152]|uniref:helix-turn-helix domain-containing protein n=1 Tax=unclassified Nostoc TaxID=2593658 RepID=UPI001689026B|nr:MULTISPECIES: helix-turn-helix domain-containing protein [unclassified Nostoc]MBD2448296.1 helix-turn-helix domain-containing protein [Nostoc sp. FACHB-152]MBD2467458.1 helix-turn-helix domain-containing protein [Nostoc sp. FACHB-145]